MIIDCDTCTVRGDACGDCVVGVLLGSPAALDGEEQRALGVLAQSGLIPPLRLVPLESPLEVPGPSSEEHGEPGRRESPRRAAGES